MQLGPTEQGRLMVFLAAELARRTRAQGLLLNAPEAIAIASDAMHLAARGGLGFDEVVSVGRQSVAAAELMDGVADLIAEIRVEVMLEEGTRLIVLRGLASGGSEAASGFSGTPGEFHYGNEPLLLNGSLASFELDVTNHSQFPVRISSHFPFDRVNSRLTFDRAAAVGARLDIPAGDTVRWAPGESHRVRLVMVDASPRSL